MDHIADIEGGGKHYVDWKSEDKQLMISEPGVSYLQQSKIDLNDQMASCQTCFPPSWPFPC